jgi:ABC-2 type transport system permease protein
MVDGDFRQLIGIRRDASSLTGYIAQMSKVWTVARKEWLETVRDGQFRWAAAIVFVLFASALAIGWRQYVNVRAERESGQRTSREQWLRQGPRNPHSAAHFGLYAFKPRLPLSFLDPGMDAYTGAAVWLEAHYQNPLRFRSAEDATALQRFGELTAAMALQVFLPLLVILLAFSRFASESEHGTLRHLLSLGVPRRTLALGKTLGVAAALGCMVVPAAIAGVAVLAMTSEHGILIGTMSRLAVMIAAYCVYLAIFVAVSLAVSAMASSSRVALACLLGVWTVSTFIVPRVASDLAERLYPVPTSQAFWQSVDGEIHGADGHSGFERAGLDLKRRLLAQYGVARVEDLPVNFEGLRLQQGEEHGNLTFDRHFGDLGRTYRAQERIHHWAALFSPLIAVRSLSIAMAGTDLTHLRDFTNAAEQHRRLLNKTMNLDLAYGSKNGQYYYYRNQDLWGKVPEFDYRPPTTLTALNAQLLPAGLMVLWVVCASLALLGATRRLRAV